MMIAAPDKKESRKQEKAMERKRERERREEEKQSKETLECEEQGGNLDIDNQMDVESDTMEITEELVNEVKKNSKQNRLNFPLTVKAGMRFGCSSRGLATLTTCTLVDLGLVPKEDPHLIVDHHK